MTSRQPQLFPWLLTTGYPWVGASVLWRRSYRSLTKNPSYRLVSVATWTAWRSTLRVHSATSGTRSRRVSGLPGATPVRAQLRVRSLREEYKISSTLSSSSNYCSVTDSVCVCCFKTEFCKYILSHLKCIFYTIIIISFLVIDFMTLYFVVVHSFNATHHHTHTHTHTHTRTHTCTHTHVHTQYVLTHTHINSWLSFFLVFYFSLSTTLLPLHLSIFPSSSLYSHTIASLSYFLITNQYTHIIISLLTVPLIIIIIVIQQHQLIIIHDNLKNL